MSQAASKVSTKAGARPAIERTIANCRILVISGYDTRELKPKPGEDKGRTMFIQQAVITGGDRNINYDITHFSEEALMEEGAYLFSKNSLKLGQYDRLELSTWADDYVRLRDLTDEERNLFQSSANDASDLLG